MLTEPVHYAVIGGAAAIAGEHVQAIVALPSVRLTAIADVNAENGTTRARELGCAFYSDYQELLRQERPDVVSICTPHPTHAKIAIAALEAGSHVLCEKPLASLLSEADAMIAAAERTGKLLAVNFQQRFRPEIEYARALIASGELGELVRSLCVAPWLRTHAYFKTASWRGTWEGEGGGVLLNQAPHTIDLFIYLAGLPTRVWGITRTMRQPIATEDVASVLVEYGNGAQGYFVASTVEAGPLGRTELVFENGILVLRNGTLQRYAFTPGLAEHIRTSPRPFAEPEVTEIPVELQGGRASHMEVYADFDRAVREGGTPRAPGREGLWSLEFSSATILSSYTERPVTLPVDRAAYDALIADLIEEERTRVRTV
jgi:predicted dehydrogenase